MANCHTVEVLLNKGELYVANTFWKIWAFGTIARMIRIPDIDPFMEYVLKYKSTIDSNIRTFAAHLFLKEFVERMHCNEP